AYNGHDRKEHLDVTDNCAVAARADMVARDGSWGRTDRAACSSRCMAVLLRRSGDGAVEVAHAGCTHDRVGVFDHRKGPDRGFEYASTRSADERDVERTPNRKPEEIVADKLAEGESILAAITVDGIGKLQAAAQAVDGDRRTPRERRAAYDLETEGIESQ